MLGGRAGNQALHFSKSDSPSELQIRVIPEVLMLLSGVS